MIDSFQQKKMSILYMKNVNDVYRNNVDHILKMLNLYWKNVKHVLE